MKRHLSPGRLEDHVPMTTSSDGYEELSPRSLAARVSPPRLRRRLVEREKHNIKESPELQKKDPVLPSVEAVEAGTVQIEDHRAFFSSHLSKVSRDTSTTSPSTPRISITGFTNLYKRHQHPHGHLFVVHQHDHPIAGTHYDLRLQFSESSSISFAIMYGLPGNANSKRLNRNAMETRVHNLWVLPSERQQKKPTTDDELSSDTSEARGRSSSGLPQNEKLIEAFHQHKIRLRLHGTRLPRGYTISMRMPPYSTLYDKKPSISRAKRRKNSGRHNTGATSPPSSPSRNLHQSDDDGRPNSRVSSPPHRNRDPAHQTSKPTIQDEIDEEEDEQIRLSNAYPGANNTIGSIHQRQWFMTLDRISSGFVRQRKPPSVASNGSNETEWIRKTHSETKHADVSSRGTSPTGFDPFFVLGPEVERSVVTGRTAGDVMADEGVMKGWVSRKGWRPVLE
ncbi:MAG: hypothetical protein M1823_000147 [Watsoniomyces obsoletus]|nr:MAG: hypothetical protein M1823_000147 [Watsoniomyces obsoletus]